MKLIERLREQKKTETCQRERESRELGRKLVYTEETTNVNLEVAYVKKDLAS